jgi:hypothetical protein
MIKKIIGIVVCTLVIVAAVLPVAGIMTVRNNKNVKSSFKTDRILKQNIEDKVIINEKEEQPPQTGDFKIGYLSVPAAAFVPISNSIQHHNQGDFLTGEFALFYAPVYFPHGATVLSLTFYWDDTSASEDVDLYLYRYPFGDVSQIMAEASSSGGTGSGSSQDITINYAVIDNSKYCYYLGLEFPDTLWSLFYDSAVIEYEYEVKFNSDDFSENQQTQESNDLITR